MPTYFLAMAGGFSSPRSPTLDGIRVLAVDDDRDTLELLEFLLSDYGANVITVTSANEAWERLPQLEPDILIIDIAMPEKDGYWLIRQLRNLESNKGGIIPAIALTASGFENESVRAIEAGFQILLRKPFDLVELVTAVVQLTK